MNITKTDVGYSIDTGGQWESGGWSIELNYKVSEMSGGKSCKHCGSKQTELHTSYQDGSTWNEIFWICPRVVVAVNEGGHNSTGVCLDCIIEAAEQLKTCN